MQSIKRTQEPQITNEEIMAALGTSRRQANILLTSELFLTMMEANKEVDVVWQQSTLVSLHTQG